MYEGFRRIDKVTYKLQDGREKDCDIKIEGIGVAVFALSEKNEVILTKQYRPGPDKIVDDLPGGGVDQNEDIQEAVERELLEETGYRGDCTYLMSYHASPYSTGVKHSFIALNCKKIAKQKLDDTEFIEVTLKSMEEFKKQLWAGEVMDTVTAFAAISKLSENSRAK